MSCHHPRPDLGLLWQFLRHICDDLCPVIALLGIFLESNNSPDVIGCKIRMEGTKKPLYIYMASMSSL